MLGIESFGKDHWSLMAYLGYLASNNFNIDRRRMRCNEVKHPLLNGKPSHLKWDDSYSTHLKSENIIVGHDDWDCLDDLEDHDFVNIISLANGVFLLTEKGAECQKQLTLHKQAGQKFKEFDFKSQI
jgi:hypothetical protein